MNTENNKLIAEFMELKKFQSQLDYTIYDIPQHKRDVVTEQNGGTLFAEMDLKYHSDWNWLMEVVEKIEEKYIVDVCGKAVSIHENNGEMMVDLSGKKFSSKIDAVYNACLDFIKWYNQQNK